MNKKFVYQVGNNKKVILWCTANQISRLAEWMDTTLSDCRLNSSANMYWYHRNIFNMKKNAADASAMVKMENKIQEVKI
jgi:hypothetical protein